jgi:hypothetical protein
MSGTGLSAQIITGSRGDTSRRDTHVGLLPHNAGGELETGEITMQMAKTERARINAQGFTFIARGPNAWGEGETEQKAISRCVRSLPYRGKKGETYKIETFKCSTNAYVNDMNGSIMCDPKWEPKPAKDFIEPIDEITRKW